MPDSLLVSLELSPSSITAYVLFDLLLILFLARGLGSLAVLLRQPRVVGEIFAGVLLGPTLLGDDFSFVLVPEQVRPILGSIATLGLVLFMVLAGLEFDVKRVHGRGRQATILAIFSVFVPALLGFPLAWLMYDTNFLGSGNPGLLPFALMLGAALAVTAFPVMAHILLEQNQLATSLGTLAVATAGIMSILMFSYIGFATAVASAGNLTLIFLQLGAGLLFILIVWFGLQPLLPHFFPNDGQQLQSNHLAIFFGGMTLFALIAHLLGLNALIGGFIWGLIIPTMSDLRRALAGRIVDITIVFLLPVFFAIAGFSTNLRLISLELLPIVLLVTITAVLAKFLPVVPIHWSGFSWSEVGTLGALFNTRGLLILLVGLIGVQEEVFSELTFTILVIVALITNLMTLPLLAFFSSSEEQ